MNEGRENLKNKLNTLAPSSLGKISFKKEIYT